MSQKLTKASKAVVHHIPGRTRVKIPKMHRHQLHQLKNHLAKTPGVKSVEVNHETGSLLVHHDQDAPIFEILHKTVETVGTDMLTMLIEGGESAELFGPLGLVAAGVGIVFTVGKSLIGSVIPAAGPQTDVKPLLTGSAADLKTLVPTAFLIAAIYKAYETRSFWQGLTPLALLYFSFDTYWKFNVTQAQILEHHDGGNGHRKEEESQHG